MASGYLQLIRSSYLENTIDHNNSKGTTDISYRREQYFTHPISKALHYNVYLDRHD